MEEQGLERNQPGEDAPTESKREKPGNGLGCGLLFTVPFALGGCFMLFLVLAELFEFHRMQSWEPVQMHLRAVEFKTYRGSESTTYGVEASYAYTVDGQEYEGTRVALEFGSDSARKLHMSRYRTLKQRMDQEEPFMGYVDPRDPGFSVLFTEMRWGRLTLLLLMGTLFAGIGIVMLVSVLRGHQEEKENADLRRRHPDQPWRWNKRWDGGRIVHSEKGRLVGSAIFAALWNLIGIPVAVLVLVYEDQPARMAVGLLYPGLGLLLLVGLVLMWRSYLKYGQSVLEMGATPGVLGGRLSGMVHTQVGLRPEEGFHVTLSCTRRERRGSGKNRSTVERILWQDSMVVRKDAMAHDHSRSAIPVLFALPHDQPPSSTKAGSNKVRWKLEVRARVPGVDYAADFEVPVFQTPDSDPDFELDRSAIRDFVLDTDPRQELAQAGVRVEPDRAGSGVRYYFPPGREKALAAGVTLMALAWTGLVIIMWNAGAPWLLVGIMGFFAALLLVGVVRSWLGWKELRVEPGNLRLRQGLLGFSKERTLPVSEIEEVEVAPGHQRGSRLTYQLTVRAKDGTMHKLGGVLPDQHLARVLRDDIRQRLGLPRVKSSDS